MTVSTANAGAVNGLGVLAATILGSSMVFIDGTVVNVALPALQEELGASVGGVQWVIESYALMLAALLLVGGALGDIFGRRVVFAIGIVIFTLASAWCGLAPDIEQLIIARGAQGIGGALMVPGSLAIISASFAGNQRGRAIGTWSSFTAITTAAGPVLGGWLIENASWRWVFFINLPLALVVLALLLRFVPESRDETASHTIDWAGALLVTLGLGALVYGLIEAGALGLTHPRVLIALTLGVGGLAAFVVVEARSPAPMMPLELFRVPVFRGANLLTLLLYGALGGALFFLPFNLIQVQGYSATAAGAALLPLVACISILSRWSGGLVQRYGARLPLIVGPTIAGAGFALFALPGIGGSYWTTFFPAVLVLGLGMAVTIAPLTTTVMSALEQRHAGLASGVNNAVSRVAGLLAIAALGIVAVQTFGTALQTRLAALGTPPALTAALLEQQDRLAALEIPAGLDAALQTQLQQAIGESFVTSFRWIMLIAAALSLLSALVAFVTIQRSSRPTRAESGDLSSAENHKR